MTFDFNKEIDRKNTWSLKWDYNENIFGNKEVLPMWVADMDFPSPEAVGRAVAERTRHGVFGYTGIPDTYLTAAAGWLKKRHGWETDGDWFVHSPGVVTSLRASILAFTQPGDAVLIQTPVYPPFFSAVTENGRRLVTNPLRNAGGRYIMDFEDLDRKLPGVKMMILCSPHNPVGRVWDLSELETAAALCSKHGVMMVSDEIHSDIVYKGHRHIPAASLAGVSLGAVITLISPTKTFNIAGLSTSFAIIPDPKQRKGFKEVLHATGADISNIFGLTAGEAAYREGAQWLDSLLSYLEENISATVDYFKSKIPCIKATRPEGTYLVWLDCREMGLTGAQLKDFFINKAQVGLNDGLTFGPDGAFFQRLNAACPRPLLMEGLSRIEKAVSALRR